MKRLALLILLIPGCTPPAASVPDEIRVNVHVYHHQGYGDGLPEAAHNVLPQANPEGDGK